MCARTLCNRVWLHEVRARANGVSDRRLFAKPGEMTPGRVLYKGESPQIGFTLHHAIFELLPIAITTTGIPASFEQTQRVPTGHPDVCLCDVSGATNYERESKTRNLAVIALHHTAHARALVFGERRRLSPLVPTAIGRVLVRVRVLVPFLRENAYTADNNGALLRTARGSLCTRARFARNETRGRRLSPPRLAQSVCAWRHGVHVDTTIACLPR